MREGELSAFAANEPLSMRSMRRFCEMAMEQELKTLGLAERPMLRLRLLFGRANGIVRRKGSKKCITIDPFLVLHRRRTQSAALGYFYLYAVLTHELSHILLEDDLMSEKFPSYQQFWAGVGQTFCAGRRQTDGVPLLFRLIFYRKNEQRRAVSLEELFCTYIGLSHAAAQLSAALSPPEWERMEKIVESAEFCLKHMEISYTRVGSAYDRKTGDFLELARSVEKEKALLGTFRQLRFLFDECGRLYHPYEMIKRAQASENGFYDENLLMLFLSFDLDWEEMFESVPEMKRYMERLANQYYDKCVNYFDYMTIGEIFLSRQALQDNAALILKNVRCLDTLMRRFGMEHTSGSVMAL